MSISLKMEDLKMKPKIITLIIFVILVIFSVPGCLNKTNKIVFAKNTPTSTTSSTTNSPEITPTQKVPRTAAKDIKVPILMYHSVTDKVWGYTNLHVSPKEFDAQMKYLKDNKYTALDFSELEYAGEYTKPILITLDDGYENNYTEAYPILKKYNIKATIFVCSGFIGNKTSLKVNQIKEMEGLVDIQSHTVTHSDLTKLNDESLERELKKSKEKLEEITGKKVYAFAYPAGQHNSKVIEMTKKYYEYAVLDRPYGFYYTGEDKYTIKRKYVSRETSIKGFAELVN